MGGLFARLRGLLFYFGYALSLVIYASLCLLVGWMLPIHRRYPFFVVWNRFAIWWLKVACGVRYRIQGLEHLPPVPYVMASNHQSPWETLLLYERFPPLCAILKIELLSIPFFGWALKLLDPIPIDRSKPKLARVTLLREGIERLDNDISVLVFPEGTRVEPGVDKKFSHGAAELAISSGKPLVPVAHNAGKFWPAHRLVKTPGVIDLVIGRPIATAGRQPRELTEEIQTWVRQRLAELP